MNKQLIATVAGRYINLMAHVAPALAADHGFRLFCRPFRAPLKDYHKAFLHTADLFEFDYDGIRIQAYRWGNGPKKVLFLHGWQSHTFRWKNYIEALDKDLYTIYAFDAPGHGLSAGNYINVPFYGMVITHLLETIGEVHAMIGHSLGGFSSLYTLYSHPTVKVNNLILMAPPGEASDFVDFYQKTLNLSPRAMTLVHERFIKEFKVPITWFSTAKFAEAVRIPGLIIHDEGDLEAPYHYARRIQEKWGQATLLTTKGLGHNLKSPAVVGAVSGFLQGDPTALHIPVADTSLAPS
jgi:pimeloyl-ACP methyl ester carboxylesterase